MIVQILLKDGFLWHLKSSIEALSHYSIEALLRDQAATQFNGYFEIVRSHFNGRIFNKAALIPFIGDRLCKYLISKTLRDCSLFLSILPN